MAFDFSHAVTAPFRMQPGLRKLSDGSSQLTPSLAGGRHLREKLAVLSHWPQEALLQVPGFDAGPALAQTWQQAQAEHPQAFRWNEASGECQALLLGWSVTPGGDLHERTGPGGRPAWPEVGRCLAGLPAHWRQAGLLCLAIEEDLAIVDGQTASLPWLAVALPSHWDPCQKIGRHFAEVHAPVADSQVLVAAGAHLMKLATGAQRWERFVWNIVPEPRLHQHPKRIDPQAWGLVPPSLNTLAELGWFRTERQTFIPLPDRGQAVFTIQVDCQPLQRAIRTSTQARALHQAVASMSPAVLTYRGLAAVRDTVLAWLDRLAESTRP